MIRSLPIRLEPRAGESLTSWLCAHARRNQVSWHQILVAVGLYRQRRDTQRLEVGGATSRLRNLCTGNGDRPARPDAA